MQAIPPIDARPSSGLTPMPSLRGTGSAAGAQSPAASSSSSGTGAMSRIDSAVATMLSSIGGGVENDRMLRMLIGVMILMALLEQVFGSGQRGGGQEQGIEAPGAGNGSLSISYTSLSIEQSTTTIVMGSEASAAFQDSAPQQGGSVDVTG